jgi:hypothetical protein
LRAACRASWQACALGYRHSSITLFSMPAKQARQGRGGGPPHTLCQSTLNRSCMVGEFAAA